jgi:hypothetical protein
MEELRGREDFDAARFKAFRRAIRSTLTGGARRLVSLDRILDTAGLEGQSDRGVQDIRLDRVIGSAAQGRGRDFDPAFLPVAPRLRQRWARVYSAMAEGAEIPPIDVYKLDGSYYVRDGHHRVSVARRLGRDTIRAHVTEVRTRVPLGPEVDAAELLKAAEYAEFLEATQLDRVRPEARVECSRLGRYREILGHILGHRYFLGLEQGREVSLPEAAASWYDTVYCPIADVIRRHRVLEQLPGWTEADLYVELTRRWLELSETGLDSGPHAAVHALMDKETRRWWRRRSSIRL